MPEREAPEPKLPPPNRNFDGLNELMIKAEVEGGISSEQIRVGEGIEIQTEHTKYILTHEPDGFYISGHPKLCPTPVKMSSFGSKLSGHTSLKQDFIGREMQFEFVLQDMPKNDLGMVRPITTSTVKEITLLQKKD